MNAARGEGWGSSSSGQPRASRTCRSCRRRRAYRWRTSRRRSCSGETLDELGIDDARSAPLRGQGVFPLATPRRRSSAPRCARRARVMGIGVPGARLRSSAPAPSASTSRLRARSKVRTWRRTRTRRSSRSRPPDPAATWSDRPPAPRRRLRAHDRRPDRDLPSRGRASPSTTIDADRAETTLRQGAYSLRPRHRRGGATDRERPLRTRGPGQRPLHFTTTALARARCSALEGGRRRRARQLAAGWYALG